MSLALFKLRLIDDKSRALFPQSDTDEEELTAVILCKNTVIEEKLSRKINSN